MTWRDTVEQALENLGGKGRLEDIYDEVRRIREKHGDTTPVSLKAVVRKELEYNSSDSDVWHRNHDLFFSVHGIGSGFWGLRNRIAEPPIASDINEPKDGSKGQTIEQTIYRIIRDTVMTRKIKALHDFKCQICGASITLPDGKEYVEAHHIIPIGSPHNGPDIPTNIVIVCPNHHAMLDFGCISLDVTSLRQSEGHSISLDSIDYHNNTIHREPYRG